MELGTQIKGQGKFRENFFVLFVFKIMKVKHLFPMLETKNLEQTIEFYTRVLGFECRGVYPPENPCWASLWNGEAEIAFGLPNAHTGFENPRLTGSIYLNVDNVDALWESLKARARIAYPIETMEYGVREFGLLDDNGYQLSFAQHVAAN